MRAQNNVVKYIKCRDENHLLVPVLFSQIYIIACSQYSDVDVTDSQCVMKYLTEDLNIDEHNASLLEHPIVSLGRKKQGLW